jgi:hypothetical protein
MSEDADATKKTPIAIAAIRSALLQRVQSAFMSRIALSMPDEQRGRPRPVDLGDKIDHLAAARNSVFTVRQTPYRAEPLRVPPRLRLGLDGRNGAHPMPKPCWIATVVLSAAFCAGTGVAHAQQFSADLVNGVGAGKAAQAERIYVADGKMRIEMAERGALLVDPVAKRSYMVMDAQKTYVEMPRGGAVASILMPIDPDNPCPQWQELARSSGKDPDGAWTCKRVGPETLNGRAAIKYQATSPKGEQIYGWIDPKLRFLVKSENAKHQGMELRNIVEGPQDGSRFVLPSGYHKLDVRQAIGKLFRQHGGEQGQ